MADCAKDFTKPIDDDSSVSLVAIRIHILPAPNIFAYLYNRE